jgi:hypothetical protein
VYWEECEFDGDVEGDSGVGGGVEWEVVEGEGGRNGEWTFYNDCFVRQEGFMVRVAERRG